MKYGKEYERVLRESSFPREWVNSAIQYNQLKKLIKNVVLELQTFGLNPDVLNDLLEHPHSKASRQSRSRSNSPTPPRTPRSEASNTEDRPGARSNVSVPGRSTPRKQSESPRRLSTASYEIDGSSAADLTSRLRLRLPHSHSKPLLPVFSQLLDSEPNSPTTIMFAVEADNEANTFIAPGPDADEVRGAGGASAPILDSKGDIESEADKCAEGEQVALVSSSASYLDTTSTVWALQRGSGDLGSVKATLERIPTGESANVDLDDELVVGIPSEPQLPIPPSAFAGAISRHATTGEVIIDLPSDALFFNVFSQALAQLDRLASALKDQFTTEITELSRAVGDTARPTGKRKSDLAAWREVFSLWVEAEIFESAAERHRGERSVHEVEVRLKAFAAELVKRHLGDGRRFKSKQARAAVERFMQLNVSLLDLKKFQVANAEAARKILKKHDKRTALKATSEYSALVRSSQHANSLLIPFAAHATLPHMLLTTLTETLLPVVPQIDDYMCLICTSIAFKPIRLACGHMFCVRCLSKMQKRGQAECPLCRAQTVLQADRKNVDWALLRFLQEWFPKETKEKDAANAKEAGKEELEAMGLNDKCVVM